MNFKNFLLFIVTTVPLTLTAQKGLTDFPELMMTDIPGAPKLGKPVLVTGGSNKVVGQGHGLAAPAFHDMNEDGLKDLLIGEFGSGVEHGGRYVGNFIRVYLNIGTEDKPEFDGRFDYARPPFEYKVLAHGTPYSVDQFCCMGFAPQFIDLNNDGYMDMITGSYYGEVSWFRGSEAGFLPGESLVQVGSDTRGIDWSKNLQYWFYSAASFGDFTGDELPDLITGGKSLRISVNIGTKESPKFDKRVLLQDTEGKPLKVHDYSNDELNELIKFGQLVPEGGDKDLSPFVVDWDNDAVLDLLVTNSYTHFGLPVVSFYRGMKIENEYRFEPAIPLLSTRNGEKCFPGSAPRIFVTDWNNDGINDLLVGTSIVTVNGKFNEQLSWNWEKDTGIPSAGKDPANRNETTTAPDKLSRYKQYLKAPDGTTVDEYLTLRHEGYVYVMFGSKAETKPARVKKQKTKLK